MKIPFWIHGLLVPIFYFFWFIFLIIYLIKTHKYLILKIIRKMFYEAKHVEHKSHVWFLF